MKLQRTIEQWRNCDPETMAYKQSEPAIAYAFEDAKADILALSSEVDRLHTEVARLQKESGRTRALVAEQAEDESLWFDAQTVPEAHLQQALRELHAAVEGEPNVPQS